MTRTIIAMAAALLVGALATPSSAQTAPAGSGAASPAQAAEETRPSRRSRKRDGAKREMSVNQMAASERRKKCSAEWKEAKAAGKTNGLKWPKFYGQCNARLKGNSA
jgi:hypothetical protein